MHKESVTMHVHTIVKLIREYVAFENCQAEKNRRAYEREGHGKSERHFVLRGGRGVVREGSMASTTRPSGRSSIKMNT